MFSRFIGQRNPEKDEERLLTSLGAANVFETSQAYPDFIPILKAYDQTATQFVWIGLTSPPIEILDTSITTVMGTFMVPTNYSGSLTIETIFHQTSNDGNDMVIEHALYYAAEGESSIENYASFNSGDPYTHTPGNTNIQVEFPITFSVSGGEFIQIFFKRVGTDGSDDTTGHTRVWGWRITYS